MCVGADDNITVFGSVANSIELIPLIRSGIDARTCFNSSGVNLDEGRFLQGIFPHFDSLVCVEVRGWPSSKKFGDMHIRIRVAMFPQFKRLKAGRLNIVTCPNKQKSCIAYIFLLNLSLSLFIASPKRKCILWS